MFNLGAVGEVKSRSKAIANGTPKANTLILTNGCSQHAYAALGDESVIAIMGEGIDIPPNSAVTVPIGSNSYVAAIGSLVTVVPTIQ